MPTEAKESPMESPTASKSASPSTQPNTTPPNATPSHSSKGSKSLLVSTARPLNRSDKELLHPLPEPPVKSVKSKKGKTQKNSKRLVWRDIFAEVKPVKPWWKCCCKSDSEPQIVLNQISGVAEPGQITFLMGSSGAGKTTLLNILTQRARGLRIYGEIQVNSHIVRPGEMRKMSAYVPQEDIFVGALTVKETLMMAARLRMPNKTSKQERMRRMEQVMKEMGLESCMDTRIGCRHEKSISMGEKKRLSFACEILTDPPILFCDEPTSGLDSFMALQVMKSLSKLAKEGKTIICSIHQPSSQVFEMADRLVLLVLGRIAYQGPIKDVENFFSECKMPVPQYVSVPDHFMKVLSRNNHTESEEEYKDRTERVFTNYKDCGYEATVHTETRKQDTSSTRARMRLEFSNSDYPSSWWTQFVWLLWRGMKVVLRDPMVIRVRLFQCCLVSVLLGILYWRTSFTKAKIANVRGMSFAVLRDMNMMFLMPCVHVFTEELHVVYREYQAAMYCSSAYYMGKQIADSLQYLVLPTIYGTVIYWMAGLDYSVLQWIVYWSVALLQAVVSTSIGYSAACIFGYLPLAAFIVPMFTVPMMCFAGFYIDLETIPMYFKPFTYFSWYHYAYNINMINTFGSKYDVIEDCVDANGTLGEGYGACVAATGREMLSVWHINADTMWVNYIALFLIAFAWRTIALVALEIRVRRH